MNAYAYCPRRFYYEFALGEMIVNEHVLEGQQLHERVDTTGSRARDEKLQMRRLYVCAPHLGLVGYCDLLEIENTAIGDDLLAAAKDGKIYPVEYKKGKMGNGSPTIPNCAPRRWHWRKYSNLKREASGTAMSSTSVPPDGTK